MNRITATFSLSFLLILAVCFEKKPEFIVKQVYSVDSLQVVYKDEAKAIVSLTATVPNPCYTYSHFKQQLHDDTLKIKVYAKIDPKVNCIQILGKIKCEIEIDLKRKKTANVNFLGLNKNYYFQLNTNNRKEAHDLE